MKYTYSDLASQVLDWVARTARHRANRHAPDIYGAVERIRPHWPSTFADFDLLRYDPAVVAAVKRIAKSFMEQDTSPSAGPFALQWDPTEANTALEDWLISLRVIPESELPDTDPDVTPNYYRLAGATGPRVMPKTDVAEFLHARQPHCYITSVRSVTWGGVEVTYSINEAFVAEGERRFMERAGLINATARVGEETYNPFVSWLDDDGNITEDTVVGSYAMVSETRTLYSLENVAEKLSRARQDYRREVMGRIRNTQAESNAAEERARAEHAAKTLANFEKHRDRQNIDSFGVMHIPTLPMVPNGTRASRRWGIEIETGAGRDLRGVPSGWDSKGDGSLESAYGDSASYRYVDWSECPDWADEHDIDQQTIEDVRENPDTGEEHYVEVISDQYRSPLDCSSCGWVERDYYDQENEDCVELVSPILTSAHSRGLKQITADLEFAPSTDTAGIHVHVEAKDLTVKQIRELVLSYDHIEFLLESSYDREERGYCKRRSARELLTIARAARNPFQTVRDLEKGDRYVTVNLISLDYHGTVEFRAMGPRYNYDHLVRWAMFCREMVNVAAAGASSKEFAKVKTWEDVTAIFTRYGIEYNMAAGVSEPATLSADEDALASV